MLCGGGVVKHGDSDKEEMQQKDLETRSRSRQFADVIHAQKAKSSREAHFLFVTACHRRNRLGSPCREQGTGQGSTTSWIAHQDSSIMLMPRQLNMLNIMSYINITNGCSTPQEDPVALINEQLLNQGFAAVKRPENHLKPSASLNVSAGTVALAVNRMSLSGTT